MVVEPVPDQPRASAASATHPSRTRHESDEPDQVLAPAAAERATMSDAVGALRQGPDRYGAIQDGRPDEAPVAADRPQVGSATPVDAAAWRAETVATQVASLYRELFPAVF